MSQHFHYRNNCPLPRMAIDQPKGDASATMGDAKKDASNGDVDMACHLEQSQYTSFLGFQNSCEKANFHTTFLLYLPNMDEHNHVKRGMWGFEGVWGHFFYATCSISIQLDIWNIIVPMRSSTSRSNIGISSYRYNSIWFFSPTSSITWQHGDTAALLPNGTAEDGSCTWDYQEDASNWR